MLTLTFTEPVRVDTVNASGMLLSDFVAPLAIATVDFRKAFDLVTASGNSISIVISTTDMNTIKLNGALCKRPTGTDCFVRLLSTFVTDSFGNALQPVLPSNLTSFAARVVSDTTAPMSEVVSSPP